MNDEHLRKKLGLYYHPLFQAIVQEWASVFLNGQNAMDIITFIEINLRAQKAILPEVDFGNSLSSALNDWIREISSLSQEDVVSQKTPAKIENNEDTLRAIQKILENFPFELTLSIEDYISFFDEQLDLIKMSYVVDKMSTEGFGKFLFDLCYSWCEHLDIELFSFFLLSVFYQTIRFESQGYLEARSFEDVYYFPESLLVQLKLLKTHYSRYKKVDLTSYDSWYEWNYLPHRINEIKQKLMEVFANIFREDENVAGYLEGLYWSSIQDITQKGLDKPSTAHFTIFAKENIEPQYTSTREALIESIINGEHPMNIQNSLQQKNMQSPKTLNQTKKKPIVPLVENISVQYGQEEEGQVRTLKSIVPFLGDIEPAMQGDPLQKQTQLYPIWEHEVSDTTSIATRCSVERDTPLKINKKIRDLSREKARHIISAKREDKNYRGHTPIKGNDSNSSGHFAQNLSASGKIKTTISPRMLEQLSIPQLFTPVWSPKVFSETPNEHKTNNNILCETNSTKNGRLSAPLVKNTVKMMLASSSGAMNLRNAIFEEVGSNNNLKRGMADKKLMKLFGPPSENIQRSATAVRTRQKGRTYKEVSSELTKLLKDDRYDFTIVGKSTAQEEELLLSSRGKYGLDLQAIDVEERDQRENLKLEQVTWTKSPKLNLTYRAQSTRVNRSPYREYTSPEAKGKTSRGMNKRPAIGTYLQVSNEAKKDNNYSHIKLLFPQTTVARTTQVKIATSRPELDQQAIGKNLKDLFGKMKEKQENTRKKQDIRIKRIKKNDSKQNTQVTSQLIEVKKI